MISVFVREQYRYSFDQLNELLKGSCADVYEIIKLLKYKGIIKLVKKTSEQVDLSDLTDVDFVKEDVRGEVLYVFAYVGVVAVKDIVLKCYPKYLKKTSAPVQQLKQALRVIEKYDSKSQKINLYDDISENTTVNKLVVMIFLLRDFFEYGLYSSIKDIIDENGRGEIIWDKTINNTYALLSNDEPYYTSLYTRCHIADEQDFFRRLHACVIQQIFRELELVELTELFDIASVPVSDEELENLGDTDYFLYRLERETDVQFNTRKQLLLKAMYSYIADREFTTGENDSVSMYGTANFNLVWENVCNDILGDQRYLPMGALELPQKLDEKYRASDTLISVIEKPGWYGVGSNGLNFRKTADRTLVPDFLAVRKIEGKCCFIILDAKHYNLQLEEDSPLSGQPGIESVTKQYLYELAYKEFIQSNRIDYVSNCFLFPTEMDTIQLKGHVELSFLHNQGLQNISIRLLPASKVFEYYLTDRKMDIEDLQLPFGVLEYRFSEQGSKNV